MFAFEVYFADIDCNGFFLLTALYGGGLYFKIMLINSLDWQNNEKILKWVKGRRRGYYWGILVFSQLYLVFECNVALTLLSMGI